MMNAIIFASISFLISLLLLPVQIKLFTQWRVFDSSGKHKIHTTFTPSMGGLSIFIGVMVTLLMSLPVREWLSMKYFFISLALMFIIGLRDDILALTAKQKLYSQFLPVVILIFLDGTMLNSSYNLIGDQNFPDWLAYTLSIFVVIILTNAYNLIDGLDGLAGTIGFLTLLFLGIWFYLTGTDSLSLIALTCGGSILAFLIFNWQPSRIFMGDTGALMIGFLISYLIIRFINVNFNLPADHPQRFSSSVGAAVCIFMIPIFDTLRVIILRLRKLQSPFRADRNHIHHQFLNLGFSHSRSVIFIAMISVFFMSIAVLLRHASDAIVIGTGIMICLVINFILKKTQRIKEAANGRQDKIN
jgi:UDP-GlcNAc:undecaprenyl-phosphate/decaprenyl-phosphate GlcNAc-1-phosphate transferase